MNQTLQKPTTNRLRFRLENVPAKKEAALSLSEPSAPTKKPIASRQLSLFRKRPVHNLAILSLLSIVTVFGFQSGDVIEQEASKALLVVLLLCQIKNLSQPAKQS